MSKKSIPQFNKDEQALNPNQVLGLLAAFYKKRTNLVIQYLYRELHYTYRDVSKILGIHEQTVRDTYPKEEKGE
jgi:hypothetical protein